MRQLALDFPVSPPPALENFVAGRNAELMQALRRLASAQQAERFIYIWGPRGCGRSHLLRATVSALHDREAGAAYVACAAGAGLPAAVERVNCVALDDVDRLDPDAQLAVFHLYNALRERDGALLASGPAPPVQLRLRADLVTRLGWGLVYQVNALADEEKERALVEHAAARGFRLAPEVCGFLMTRTRRDMPALLALLEALDRYSLETRRPVTVPLARELLSAAGKRDPGGAG